MILNRFSKLFKNIENEKKIRNLEKRWINIMAMTGNYNKTKQTYSLNNIKVVSYGFKCDCLIVDGLNYNGLKEAIEKAEDSLGCFITIKRTGRCNVVKMRFIYNPPSKEVFSVTKSNKETDLIVGIYQTAEPIKIDMIKYPHLLIVGGTRSGKIL